METRSTDMTMGRGGVKNPTPVLRHPHACSELARLCRSVAHVTVAHTLDVSLDTTAISLNQSRSTTLARVAHTFFELSVQHDSGVGLIQLCRQKVWKTVEVPQFEVISAAVANQPWMKQPDKQLNEEGSQESR